MRGDFGIPHKALNCPSGMVSSFRRLSDPHNALEAMKNWGSESLASYEDGEAARAVLTCGMGRVVFLVVLKHLQCEVRLKYRKFQVILITGWNTYEGRPRYG
jgi:hypothetical protein